MATVIVYDKERMQEIEDGTVTSGSVNGMGNLILVQRGGTPIDAGNVRGPQGIQGIQGPIGNTGPTGVIGGDVALRDSIYPVPTTDAQKASLANSRVNWVNRAHGWVESYYAPATTPGLTVPGLLPGASAGWYPISTGPWAVLNGTPQTITGNVVYQNYNAFGTSRSARKGGADWFTITNSNQRLTYMKAGYYEISCRVGGPNGSGSFVNSLTTRSSAGVDIQIDQRGIFLNADYGQQVALDNGLLPITENAYTRYGLDTGTWSPVMEFMRARYVGPLLANA